MWFNILKMNTIEEVAYSIIYHYADKHNTERLISIYEDLKGMREGGEKRKRMAEEAWKTISEDANKKKDAAPKPKIKGEPKKIISDWLLSQGYKSKTIADKLTEDMQFSFGEEPLKVEFEEIEDTIDTAVSTFKRKYERYTKNLTKDSVISFDEQIRRRKEEQKRKKQMRGKTYIRRKGQGKKPKQSSQKKTRSQRQASAQKDRDKQTQKDRDYREEEQRKLRDERRGL